jgi:hypothetical protein
LLLAAAVSAPYYGGYGYDPYYYGYAPAYGYGPYGYGYRRAYYGYGGYYPRYRYAGYPYRRHYYRLVATPPIVGTPTVENRAALAHHGKTAYRDSRAHARGWN